MCLSPNGYFVTEALAVQFPRCRLLSLAGRLRWMYSCKREELQEFASQLKSNSIQSQVRTGQRSEDALKSVMRDQAKLNVGKP